MKYSKRESRGILPDMSAEIPPGLSEKDLEEMRKIRMAELLHGDHGNTYDEWILAGKLGEPFDPSVAIALFPMMGKGRRIIFSPQVDEYVEKHEPITLYWRRLKKLPFPQRAAEYEQKYFKDLVRIGDKILQSYVPFLGMNLMPISIVVFSRPDEQTTLSSNESAYLFSPRIIPPSATYRFIQWQVEEQLTRLASTM